MVDMYFEISYVVKFGSHMSSDGVKIVALDLMTGMVEPMTVRM
jgi:hypothetical protein